METTETLRLLKGLKFNNGSNVLKQKQTTCERIKNLTYDNGDITYFV